MFISILHKRKEAQKGGLICPGTHSIHWAHIFLCLFEGSECLGSGPNGYRPHCLCMGEVGRKEGGKRWIFPTFSLANICANTGLPVDPRGAESVSYPEELREKEMDN